MPRAVQRGGGSTVWLPMNEGCKFQAPRKCTWSNLSWAVTDAPLVATPPALGSAHSWKYFKHKAETGDIWDYHHPNLKLPFRIQCKSSQIQITNQETETQTHRETGKRERGTHSPALQTKHTHKVPGCQTKVHEISWGTLVPQIVPLSVTLLMATLKELFFFGLQPELWNFTLFYLMSVFCLNCPISVL